jgi:plastocyanin
MHSFAITERYAVLVEFPFVAVPIAIPLSGRPFIENYHWRPRRGTRFRVIELETGKLRGTYEGEPFFAFHHVNAFERDDKLPSSPYGAATLANNVVFTTTFNGSLYAFESTTGKELWKTQLSAGTNAPVMVVGDTLITAGSFPLAPGQKALIIAYRLGATGTLPTSPPAATTTSTASAPAKPAPAAASTIKIEANPTGLLKFTESAITASAGEDTVTFTNNSPLEHDVVIINSANKILGQTPVFDKGSKSFKVKLEAGTYTYYCSVPGHREAGMQGTLTVKLASGLAAQAGGSGERAAARSPPPSTPSSPAAASSGAGALGGLR